MKLLKRLFSIFFSTVILSACMIQISAQGYDALGEGVYPISAKLSCYVNAMGGVEFGAALLQGAEINVSADSNKTMTLYFGKSQVTIYGITCDTFIDADPSYVTETNGVESGTLGYYTSDCVLVTDSVGYTLSNDTVENAQGEQVRYVSSMTFPIEYESDEYELSVFVNSNVMGSQFTYEGYKATLSVDWSGVSDSDDSRVEETTTEAVEKETDVETAEETEADSETAEKMEGLNIYSSDEEETEVPEHKSEPMRYMVLFNQKILVVIFILSVVLILGGTLIIISAGKKKNEKQK